VSDGEKINECVGANGGRIGEWLKDDDKLKNCYGFCEKIGV
jgi:hypothetical protein